MHPFVVCGQATKTHNKLQQLKKATYVLFVSGSNGRDVAFKFAFGSIVDFCVVETSLAQLHTSILTFANITGRRSVSQPSLAVLDGSNLGLDFCKIGETIVFGKNLFLRDCKNNKN